MSDTKLLLTLAKCYNSKNFDDMFNLLNDDVVYESFDCLYRVSSKDDVTKVMTDSVKNKTSAYDGFFMRRGIVRKRLTRCILICDDSTLQCVRIVHIKQKKKGIANITGYNPSENNYTRGKKIEQ